LKSKDASNIAQANGLLFIGDPHLSSRRPGRRTDTDFAGTVLKKLSHAFRIAREGGLQPVILGDLFDRPGEQDLMVLSRFLRLLRDHRDADGLIPVTLAGNHDMKDVTLSGDTALAVVHESGLLRVLEDAVPVPVYRMADGQDKRDSCIAVLIPYSYGQEHRLLENGVSSEDMARALGLEPEQPLSAVLAPNALVIALTHADFAFAGAYPGAREIVEIPGVDLVVNGHMHKLCPTVRRGSTLWWNPGNITRMSMDCEGHAPRVWSWRPGEDTLTGIHLPHERFVFNRVGVAVEADVDGLKAEISDAPDTFVSSRFVEMLKEQRLQDSAVTEDASGLMEEIRMVCSEKQVDEVVAGILQDMCKSLVDGLAIQGVSKYQEKRN
jgi:DNA repair exonuclease SbcCD nuclease subunit